MPNPVSGRYLTFHGIYPHSVTSLPEEGKKDREGVWVGHRA